jgi:hypothetical protein
MYLRSVYARLLCLLLLILCSAPVMALCPWNTSQDSVLGFCVDSNNAFGPFTRAMTAQCTSTGGGPACTNTVNVFYNGTSTTGIAVPVQRYAINYARSLRGTGTCPSGAVLSANYDNHCVEVTSQFGTEVYGPFPQNWIDMCRSASIGGGNACFLNRWASGVYTSVRNALGPNWKLPMPSGFTTSDWCVCRNVGTSPHIGWDLVNNGSMTSVAIESGTITSGPTLNGGCGWELQLTDRFGTKWYYRHLNKPNLTNGQSIAAGATIGLHRDYPSSSCGTGAHLHFERLSAGFFGDASVSKNCTGVLKSCNWDPRKPFPAFARASIQDQSPLVFSDVAEATPTELSAEEIARNRVCRVNPAQYAEVDAQAMFGNSQSAALNVQLNAKAVDDEPSYPAMRLTGNASFAGNLGNHCVKGAQCIVSWELYAETTSGSWQRLFADPTVRNQPVVLDADSAWCAPADASGNYRARIHDNAGRSYAVDLTP